LAVLQPSILEQQRNVDMVKKPCISQDSAVMFVHCYGQIHNHTCQIASGFYTKNYQNWLIFD